MEGANGSNLLNHLPDELLERVVAALIPAPSPFTLASDVWAGALGLALSCRRMYSITTAEAHRKLRPPGTAKPRGVLVTKEELKAASAEQLRAWADSAAIERHPKKRRRNQTVDPDAGTVKRLRRLVEQECCRALPLWEQQLFRGFARERRQVVTLTKASNKWRLSEMEQQELRLQHKRHLLLPAVVARARAKFGTEAAFLDRSRRIKATKADLCRMRTEEARSALGAWGRLQAMDWGENAPAFRQYTLFGRDPGPDTIATELARKARRKELEAALRARGLRASLAVESHFLERWWKVDLFVARRYQPVGVQAAIDGALRLEDERRARQDQLERVLEAQGVPDIEGVMIGLRLEHYITCPPFSPWGDADLCCKPEFLRERRRRRSDGELAAEVAQIHAQFQARLDPEAAAAAAAARRAAEERRAESEKRAADRLAAAGWCMLRPYPAS